MFAFNVTFVFVIVSLFIGPTHSAHHCSEHLTSNNLQLIADYASWRNIKYWLVLEAWTTCSTQVLKSAVQHFSNSDTFLSFHSVGSNHLKNAVNLPTSNVGIVAFVNKHNHHLLHQFNDEVLSAVDLSNDYVAWLVITNETDIILDGLGFTTLSLVSDLVIAVRINYSRGKVAMSNETDKGRDFLPSIVPTKNNRSVENENACKNSNYTTMENYCLLQAYKIRKELNTSLVLYTLGPWNFFEGNSNLATFKPVELRLNFHSFPLKFGRKNSSVIVPMTAQENGIEDDGNEENLSEISEYFKMFFNAGEENVYFQKLGYKDVNGKWSDLLGAVVNEDVDVAIDTVIKTPERLTDMTFTHTIMTSMRNIYIKPQKSNELRDIFLIPFETRLFLCISFILIFIVISALFISKTNPSKYESKDKPDKKPYCMKWDDAIIWTVGIFTMQGSCWKPKRISGKLILFFSLLFSLIIYNAYSAYITSILSVQLTNIRSLGDLLDSDYHIGYAKGSQDEIYLRSMNNTQLQQIYLRGYLQNTVNSVTEGLMKSAKGHYGFFASSSVARKELQNINNYKCNDDIIEMPLQMTRNTIAFPLSKKSPYKKIMNLSIMKMYETGIFRYIHSSIVPDLLKCKKNSKKFSGAHLSDLTTAFGVIIIGSITAIICLIAECFWFKKTNINAFLHKGLHFHHGLHPHFWHHHHHHHDHHIPNPNCKCKH